MLRFDFNSAGQRTGACWQKPRRYRFTCSTCGFEWEGMLSSEHAARDYLRNMLVCPSNSHAFNVNAVFEVSSRWSKEGC